MGIDFNHVQMPTALHDVYQQLRHEQHTVGSLVATTATLEQLRRESLDLERRYLTSLSFPWRVWGEILAAMADRGMLAEVQPAPEPDLTLHGYGGPVSIEATADPAAPDIVRELVLDWLAQVPSVPGIARFKLISNDWWHVNASEARSAIQLLGSQDPADIPGWDHWIEFLLFARDRDGFIVS